MPSIMRIFTNPYQILRRWAGPVCLSIFLLLIRVVWGWQFFLAGRGKLTHVDKVVGFFRDSLHIPAPTFNRHRRPVYSSSGRSPDRRGLALVGQEGNRWSRSTITRPRFTTTRTGLWPSR